jgi:hypothetical protein
MSRSWCLTTLVLVGVVAMGVASCAVPPTTNTPPPMTAGMCNVCRYVNVRGEVWFTQCGVPHGTPQIGWQNIDGRCNYRQIPIEESSTEQPFQGF